MSNQSELPRLASAKEINRHLARQRHQLLFYFVAYRNIDHPQKDALDTWLPLGVSALVTGFFVCAELFGLTGYERARFGKVVEHTQQLASVLIGLFAASIGVVATVKSDRLDRPTRGEPAKEQIVEQDTYNESYYVVERVVAKRELLSRMFGYLTGLCICIFVAGMFKSAFLGTIRQVLPTHGALMIDACFVFVYTFLVSSLLVTTLFAVNQMAYGLRD